MGGLLMNCYIILDLETKTVIGKLQSQIEENIDNSLQVEKEYYDNLQIPSTFDSIENGILLNVQPVNLPELPKKQDLVEVLQKELDEQKALINAILGVDE